MVSVFAFMLLSKIPENRQGGGCCFAAMDEL
jgi:hypothetical protein